MFWSEPSLNELFFLLFISLVVSIFVYYKTRKIPASLFVLSVLSNLSFQYGTYYNLAKIYNFIPLYRFAKNIWPWINVGLAVILLAVYIIKKVKKKANNLK